MKCKDQNLLIDDSIKDEDIDIQNYKGIYFNDDQANRFEDPATGAHFDYFDLCKKLKNLPNCIKKSEGDENKFIDLIKIKDIKKFDLFKYLQSKENTGEEAKRNNNSQKNYYVTNVYNYKFDKAKNLNLSINNNMVPFCLMRNKMFSIDKNKKFRNRSSEFNDTDKILSGSESEENKVQSFHLRNSIRSKAPCFLNLNLSRGRNHLPISKTKFQRKYQNFTTKHNIVNMNSNKNKNTQRSEKSEIRKEKLIYNLFRPNTSAKNKYLEMKINKEVIRRSIQKAKEQIINSNSNSNRERLQSSMYWRFSNVSMDKNKRKHFTKKNGEVIITNTKNMQININHNNGNSTNRSNLNKTINVEKVYNRRIKNSNRNPSIKIENNLNLNLNQTKHYGKILSMKNTKVSEKISQTMKLYESNFHKDIKNENCFLDLQSEKLSRNNKIIKQKTMQNPSKKREMKLRLFNLICFHN